uniref:SpvB/TcaC N-terminal domain-containing protein n=1 Tax=Chryseobacterium endophyticum TaxID=1854762 RepID=A0AAU6WP18_9FLAO
MITLAADEKSKGVFSISENGNNTTYKLPQDTRSYKTVDNNFFNAKGIFVTNDQELSVDYEKANITIPKGSAAAAYIEVLKLRNKDFPGTSQGLKNVTFDNMGYRLSLISGKLSKRIKITIPYDEKRLGLLKANDIKIFRFDYEKKKKWIAETSAVVDTKTKTVSVEAEGNGDYISGIISVPESPQINALAPTAISGLKTVDPAAGLQFMSPPTANSSGSASTSYPIEIPAGVQGMAPKISVAYNSASGNGWMGEGWNVSGISDITLDTRWGTPKFDPTYESEIYLLDGEMLMYEGDYLPHRHTNGNGAMDVARQARNTYGKKNFYLRKNNGFLRIERYGTDPKTYTWVVTGTDGTKKYYGGNENNVNTNAIVITDQNNIVQWGITKELDIHNNNIKYYYDNKIFQAGVAPATGDNLNLANGRQFHIQRITYTGRDDNDGPYEIAFSSDSGQRPDLSINAKEGVKRVETSRLTDINVSYKPPGSNNGIRKYFFEYYTGAFYKTLLSKIITPGVTYQLDYHNDTNGTIFGPDKTVNAPTPDAFSGTVNSLLSPSKISADNNLEWGWSVRAGGGFALFKPHRSGDKNFMISGFFGESYPDSKRAIELIDFNGDGVTDILYRKRNGDNGIKLIPGSLDTNGNLQFSSPQQNVLNLKSNFGHTIGSTWTNGATVLFNWWKMGFDFTKSWSRTKTNTPVYLIDANSDGLPDVVKDDKVWFNRIGANGQPEMVTTSDLTENMVIKGNIPAPYTEPEEEEDDTEDEAARGKNDVVKVWIAPKTGYIKISDVISMADPIKEAVAVYSIEILNPTDLPKNGRLYLKKLAGPNPPVSVNIEHYNDYNGTPLGINTSDRILVKSGEKVYFRLHKKKGLNYVVNTSPMVTYTDDTGNAITDTPEEEQDGFQPNALKYEEKFFLNNLTKTIDFTSLGHGEINIPGFTVPKLNDDVTYKITLSKHDIVNPATDIQILYSKTYSQNTGPVAIDPVNLTFLAPAIVGSHLKFIVESDSYVYKDLEWKDIYVNNGSTALETHDVAIYPSYFVSDMKSKFHVADLGNLPQGTNSYAVSINKTGSFTPSVTGNFMYAIKKNGLVIEKRKVEIKPSGISEYTMFGGAITGLDPIPFYNGDPSQPVQLADKINILVFCATPQDRAAYESLRSQLQGKAFDIYYGSGNQLVGSTTETSVNTSEFNAISAVYHNWGQFIYNEARDIKKGDNPLDPPYNDPKDGPTGPTQSNGPDYVPNPNTPKDQYGALINSEFLDSPFGSFNHNFNSCAGITNADDYANCVGDILQADFQNIGNTNVLAGMTPVIPLIVYNVKKDNQFTQKWVNGMFTEQYAMASSFRDEESITPFFVSDDPDEPDTEVQGNDNTAMYAIEKKQKSKSKTTNFGLGIPVVSTSTSQLRDYGNINTQDFFDVNGDGYPDMLYRTQAQLTNSLGGLLGVQPNLENNGDSPISSADSFQRTNTIAFTNTAVKTVGRMISNKNADAKGDESSPWSGGLGFSNYPNSYDKGLKFWADINGDGLVDRVDKIGNEFKYRLNYGTGLNFYENFKGLDTYNSKPVGATSVSIGGGLSGLISQTSTFSSGFGISGNLTASSSTGTSKKLFRM